MSTVHSSGHGLISAWKFHLHRRFGTWTFCLHRRFCKETIRHVSFSAQVLFGMGTFQYWNIYFSTGAKMSVPKWPYCFVWCRNILVLKCPFAKNVPMLKRPHTKKPLCQKALVPKHLFAKTSMETECSCARMSTEPKSPLCRKLSRQNVRYWY